MAEGLK
jgi:hypothetical protein